MIKRCSEVPFNEVYSTFREGFSDYLIQFEISEEHFKKHFFGAEGNLLEHSFIAYDEKPVGLVLSGIREYDGVKTLRCGTMCVIPDYRKKGIAKELLQKHLDEGKKLGCTQAFLECIKANERALPFYEYMGYSTAYLLKYFNLSDKINVEPFESQLQLSAVKDKINNIEHINWQNTYDYLEYVQPQVHGTEDAFVVHKNNRVFILHVDKNKRNQGLGRKLLATAHVDSSKPLHISFPSNGNLESFVRHLNFDEDKISQVEMYKPL